MEPSSIIVMIVTLAMPNGDKSVSVKQMMSADSCRLEAQIEASDPFVASVACSELSEGILKLNFKRAPERKLPQSVVDRSMG